MAEKKTFYKKCKCNTISGFCLNQKEIDKDEKYICQDCGAEKKLSEWKNSAHKTYLNQIKNRKNGIKERKIKW